ncbi:MAG: uracil-DNA glycosylase [candidate division Zixibacteria bacterium]|nr:uracil-DNA glycosylase [candidate division Zixibacteria bacterium]
MPRKKIDSRLGELIRKGVSSGFDLGVPVIVNKDRIRKLANARGLRKFSTDAKSTATIRKSPAVSIVDPPDVVGTVEETTITGIRIGDTWSAEFNSLEDHRKEICECQNCPLGATRTNFVYGVGNPNADLMFIGEAPGKNEDEQGEPFVGRAGKLLDKILAAIDFKREDVFIANILKCRPPANRDPLPAEMEECFPYLREQIALVKPLIICALGRIAAQGLLDTKTPVGKLRGQWHSYQGVPLRVTYHPAALLRNPAFKAGCWEDVQIIRAEYERLTENAAQTLN